MTVDSSTGMTVVALIIRFEYHFFGQRCCAKAWRLFLGVSSGYIARQHRKLVQGYGMPISHGNLNNSAHRWIKVLSRYFNEL